MREEVHGDKFLSGRLVLSIGGVRLCFHPDWSDSVWRDRRIAMTTLRNSECYIPPDAPLWLCFWRFKRVRRKGGRKKVRSFVVLS